MHVQSYDPRQAWVTFPGAGKSQAWYVIDLSIDHLSKARDDPPIPDRDEGESAARYLHRLALWFAAARFPTQGDITAGFLQCLPADFAAAARLGDQLTLRTQPRSGGNILLTVCCAGYGNADLGSLPKHALRNVVGLLRLVKIPVALPLRLSQQRRDGTRAQLRENVRRANRGRRCAR